MAKIYFENLKLTAIRGKLFASLANVTCINIFEAIELSSGDYLPNQMLKDGKYLVYGGGGPTGKTHNKFNVNGETLGIGRVGARCGCVFKIQPTSWVTDNALFATKIDSRFNLDFLIQFLTYKNINQLANTSAQPVISLKRISVIEIPLIDLDLQKEIVEILNNIEKGIFDINVDKYDVSKSLGVITTSEEFNSELTHQLSLVKKLRQQLLQDAVQGKLVAQDPTDEPASELLKKIKAEKQKLIAEKKLKKEKELPPIKPEEIPFEIPENWVWCRFSDVVNIESNLVQPFDYPNSIHIAPDNIEKNTGRLLFCKTVIEDCVQSANHYFYSGQLIYSKVRPKLNKVVKVDFEGLCSADMYPLRPLANTDYIQKCMLSGYFLLEVDKFDNRVKMPKINQVQLSQIPIPLPPLSEQNRIVGKLDELMQYCKELEASIKESEAQNEKLLQQVLREALRKEPVEV